MNAERKMQNAELGKNDKGRGGIDFICVLTGNPLVPIPFSLKIKSKRAI